GHIADLIQSWIGKEPLESRNRMIAPADIVILVQNRTALFHRMISALAERGIPVAGADKMKLLEDPAVEDLMSYARAVLTPTDDLSLAEILKSPFFGYDDARLFDIAYNRKGALWAALCENQKTRNDADTIDKARRVARHEGPYAFFSFLLDRIERSDTPSGRRKLYERLGASSAEPINEFLRMALEFEYDHTRSLRHFVSWVEQNADEVKRDLEQSDNVVRVMTVHGAKGLEGEIVFLLDAHLRPSANKLGPLFWTPPVDGAARSASLPLISPSKASDGPLLETARTRAQRDDFDEYRRLLYVAATRPRERLYVCGVEQGNKKNQEDKIDSEKSWHQLCTEAFANLKGARTEPFGEWAGDRLVYSAPQSAPVDAETTTPASPPPEMPTWLFSSAPHEQPRRRLAPSRLADHAEASAEGGLDETAAFSPLRPADAARRGTVLHRLLELLPDLPPEARVDAADKLLLRHAGEFESAERRRWRDEALDVLQTPAFAAVFGPGSRAEVSITGPVMALKRADEEKPPIISGQIDRLAVLHDRILVVDYKTNRPPPQDVRDIALSYLAQMAAYRSLLRDLYPGKTVETALLWTFEARLTPLPDRLLDHSLERLRR
ncbi:MAG: 3'-5' exonuclease, partial [Pseudomonadota bacterium]